MRVTNSMVLTSTMRDLNATLSRLQQAQADLSTGRVVRKASDDPAKASAAMALRNQLRRSEFRTRELNDAAGWLGVADTALVSSLELLNRAKELAVRAASTATSDANARAAIAEELGNLRQELIAIANTKYLGRSVFNGTADGDAYDASGTYLGNDAVIMRSVAAGTDVRINLTGEEIYGAQAGPDGDLFAVLDRLATAIVAGDSAAMAAEQGKLETARVRLATATAELGSRAARLDTIRARVESDEVGLQETLSKIEDTDLAKALMDVKNRENAYTAALTAAARVIPQSLLDYLR